MTYHALSGLILLNDASTSLVSFSSHERVPDVVCNMLYKHTHGCICYIYILETVSLSDAPWHYDGLTAHAMRNFLGTLCIRVDLLRFKFYIIYFLKSSTVEINVVACSIDS